jgi:hypothetical protein
MTEEAKPKFEDRIDEAAIEIFKTLGYEGRLPDSMVQLYKRYKFHHDKLSPSKLTPGEIAFIALIGDLVENKIDVGQVVEEEPSGE